MKKTLLALCTILFFFGNAKATHIVGGSLTYEHLGGASYRILLKLYRDCTPTTVPTPVNLQTTANVEFYLGTTGVFYQSVTLQRVQYDVVNPNLDTCVADPGICVQEGLFTAIVNNLPPIPGGYHMYFETCCRNGSVDNISNPNTSGPGGGGEGFYCKISDNTQLLTNSSPQWTLPPPVFVCQGQNIGFNHSATDADGDSLVYSFYTPFSDIDYTVANDMTFTAGNPNLVNVTFLASFSANNPLDVSGATNLTITNQGIINGIPPNLGQYVAGVRCDEYRDGVLIGSIYRDFQFNVVVCPPPVQAAIGPINGCGGTTIQMQNNTTGGATSYNWDFGDASPNSSLTNPTHTYPGIGTFVVELIADPGSNCADTAYQTFTVAFSTADFTAVDSICVTSPVFFTNNSGGSAGNTINSWLYDFGDGFSSGLPNPTHTYTAGGNYTVTLIVNSTQGCQDTIQKPIFVQGLPSANAGVDTTACNNNPLVSLNGVVANCSGGLWLNTAGTYNPNNSTLITDYTPTAGEVASGFIDIVLSTTGNGLCPTAADTIRVTFIDGPLVDAGTDIQVCKDTSAVPLSGTVQFAGGGQWTTSGTGSFTPSSTDLNTTYIPSSADTAAGAVTLYLTATNVGNCITTTDTLELSFYNPPTISILNNDTACSGDPIQLLVNTSTGSGVWTTLGNGTFVPDSSANSSYIPGSNDITNGTVTLAFVTTNNGGCLAVRDTIDIAIIPSPVSAYSFTTPCFGNSSGFTDASTATGGVAGWFWDFDDGQNSSSQNPSHLYGAPGTYDVSLIVTSTNGCRDTLTQPVDVHYLPVAGFFSPNPCLNGGTDFTDTSSVTGSTITGWQWDFGDGGSDNIQNPSHTYPSAGSFSVTLIVESAFGCFDTLVQNTNVLPGPTAAFTTSDGTVNQYEDVIFTDQSTPAGTIVTWQWDFGDGSGDNTQNTIHNYDSSGVYPVMLIVTDNNGCVDTTKSDIIVFMPPVIPTGFSPGNGDGVNDVLYVLGGPFENLDFKIYNQWGQIIFESFSQSDGWDGTLRAPQSQGIIGVNGAPQPMGVYVYVVGATTLDGEFVEISGDVTLLR